tara:strand:- start:768 stop:1205 length:438 start_codon:yes stop_codon:yes gene_type:complete
MSYIRISAANYRQVVKYAKESKKIAAVKLIRNKGFMNTNVEGIGLKEAKLAAERLMHEFDISHYPDAATRGPKIFAGPVIKKMTVDFGDGEFEVDVEGMEIIALRELQKIGLEACGDILDLIGALRAFSEGKRIGVLDEENDESG